MEPADSTETSCLNVELTVTVINEENDEGSDGLRHLTAAIYYQSFLDITL